MPSVPDGPRTKTPAKLPPLRTPKHGKGKLRVGGSNGGAGGRPPEALRLASRAVFEKWLEWAAREIVSESCTDDVRLKIGATAAKYGLGTMTEATVHVDEIVPLVVTRRA